MPTRKTNKKYRPVQPKRLRNGPSASRSVIGGRSTEAAVRRLGALFQSLRRLLIS
jgi:hypothetical protein